MEKYNLEIPTPTTAFENFENSLVTNQPSEQLGAWTIFQSSSDPPSQTIRPISQPSKPRFLKWFSPRQSSQSAVTLSRDQYGKPRPMHGALLPSTNDTYRKTENKKELASEWTEFHVLESYGDHVTSVVFSPDGRTIASGSAGDAGVVQIWEVATGRQLRKLEGDRDHVTGVAFSPDCRTIASGSGGDAGVQLWEVATGRRLRKLEGHRYYITSVAFSPDGHIIASAGGSGEWLWRYKA